jgi:hypothetical protein
MTMARMESHRVDLRVDPCAQRRAGLGTTAGTRIDEALVFLAVMVSVACVIPGGALAQRQSTPENPAAAEAAHHRSVLDVRVKALTKALDLDAAQQSELKKVLEDQREQVRNVWADTAVAAPYRISATRAINDKTADRNRALLNDEQKKKYNPPRPPHEAAPDGPSVEDWMNAAKRK